MQQQHRQLPLPVQLRDDATLENFYAGADNATLLGILQAQCDGSGESTVFLHGVPGSGKSHLLQGCCHRMGEGALYLPLGELAAYPPEDVLSGVETLALVALDDLDTVLGNEAWELALFGLYNRARERGCRLLIAAQAAPRALDMQLADLRSRLGWGVVYQLHEASDEEKRAVLRFRADRRGLEMSEEVATYIVNRAPRSLEQLLAVLDRLDRASLAHQRALTIPFARQSLDW